MEQQIIMKSAAGTVLEEKAAKKLQLLFQAKKILTDAVARREYDINELDPEVKNLVKSFNDKKIIDDKVDPLPLGKKDPFSGNGDVHFGSHDLVSSVGDAKWRFSGNVCKSSATSAKLDLKVTVEDTYNFEWWGEYKEKIYGWFLTLGNNDAHIFQEVGVLRTYKWEVTFDDGRMWKW